MDVSEAHPALSSRPARNPVSVAFDNVSLVYGAGSSTLALDGVNLHVQGGKFAAIIGPSGCGKSSLLRLVAGLLRPSAGEVRVAGQPLKGPLNFAGMAFQNPALLPWRTTLRNLLLPLEIVEPYRSRFHREREAFESDARRLLAATGLADFADQYPWMLSGGMRQRASLCRALIHRPPLLLLDEPFAALDAFTREELWGVLQKIWEEQQRFTSIMVTHDLREAVFLADVVFVMSARPGRIVSVHDVTLPRPRTIDATFAPEFIQLVRSLRWAVAAS